MADLRQTSDPELRAASPPERHEAADDGLDARAASPGGGSELEQLRALNGALAERVSALEAEHAALEELFDDAPDAYVVTDEGGRIVRANRAAEELLGRASGYLTGKPLAAYVAVTERRAFRSALARSHREDVPPLLVRFGRGPWVELRVGRAAGGGALRWLIRDASDHVGRVQRLSELNEALEQRAALQAGQLAAVLDQLPVGVVFLGADGALTRADLRAQELGTEAGLGALPITDADGAALDPEEHPARQALAGADVNHVVFRVRRDDVGVALDASAAPVRSSGGDLVGAVVVYDDVTDRVRGEHAERDFISNAAHQLRTPLTAITSVVAVLQGGAKDIPHERDRFLAHLERETARLSRLAVALLALARHQRGDEEAPRSIVQLAPLVAAVLEEQPAKPDVALTMDCRSDAAAVTNAELLTEALSNLVANAVAYTERGAVTVSVRRGGPRAHIEVSDDGPGIPADASDLIFRRFFRGGGSTEPGFGLGLPIAKAAVEAAGGTLEIESTPGVGTVASISLPAARLVV